MVQLTTAPGGTYMLTYPSNNPPTNSTSVTVNSTADLISVLNSTGMVPNNPSVDNSTTALLDGFMTTQNPAWTPALAAYYSVSFNKALTMSQTMRIGLWIEN